MRAREFANFNFDIEPYEGWNGEGVIVHAYDGKDEIGHVIFEPTEDDKSQWYAVDVEVEEPYQRQGIATKMYNMAKQAAKSAGAIIVKSHTQTDAGRGLWQDKTVWEQQVNEYKEYPTREYEGVTFTMKEKDGQLIVKPLNDYGISMGHAVFNMDGKILDPQDLVIADKYQGQGIARVMYDYIKSLGFTIERSYDQTDAGRGFWNKHRGEEVRVWETSNPTNVMSAEQVWDYVGGIHPADQQGGGFLKGLIMLNPEYILKRVPLASLHIPDEEDEGNDPYNRAMFVDVDHAKEFSQYHVDKKPLVVDSQGHILDGAHRAWAARELLNRKDIMAYVPVKARANSPQDLEIRKKFINQNVTEGRGVKQEIEEFLDSLSPDDVGVEEFPGYRIHYEGFTDDCKSSIDYQRNPNRVYKQVYQDFTDREGGRKPVKSGIVGDEEYPILYSVFKVPQSKTIDTAEKAYYIAYKKKQPWPRGSREEKLIRSDWQLSGLYDQYVLKQGMAEAVHLDIDEGLKNKLAGAALAGGMALGASGANAMDWKDAAMTGAMFVPGIGQAVKAYNVGKSLYQAGTAAKQYRDASRDLDALAAQQKARPNQSSTVAYDPNYKAEIEPVDEDVPQPGDFKLMGQDLFLKNLARNLKQRYPDATVKLTGDRVVAYHNKEDDDYLTVMGTEVMDSGYIGVGLDDAFTESFQGVLVPTIKQTTEQLLAANPGTKPALFLSTDNWNPDAWTHIATKLGYMLVADDEQLDEGKRGVSESVNDYLWHGSKSEHNILYPQQAKDTGGAEGSNKNAVYATPSAKVAISMGLTTPGSITGMFPNDPQMVLFKGNIRKGEYVYLHKVPKDLFIKHNSREWYSKLDVKEVKPLEVVKVPVDKYLNLIRQATPQDWKLRQHYLDKAKNKEQGVAESKESIPSVGINVRNDGDIDYASLIVDGKKKYESRKTDSLRPYVGKTVAIIRTGSGPATAIGQVTIGEPILVNSKKFDKLRKQHLVPHGSKFDIEKDSTKYLYPMIDPKRWHNEKVVQHKGIVARKIKEQGASEQLNELFQQGKQNWTWKIKADTEAIAKFTVGDRDYMWMAYSHFRDDKPHKWEIQFRALRKSTDPEKLELYGKTGTGNSAEVMSTAVDITREFLQVYGDSVQQIAFDAKENSRIALYRKMVQRLLPNWISDEDYSTELGLRFTLTRPKQM